MNNVLASDQDGGNLEIKEDNKLLLVRDIMNRSSKIMTKELSIVDDAVMAWHRVIQEITPDAAAMLNGVSEASEMFKWWRENIPNQQELKTFIELASISAGESDIGVDRLDILDVVGN